MLPHPLANRRAERPRPPKPTRAAEAVRRKRREKLTLRERAETQSIARGLTYIILLILVVSLFRAGLHRTFVPTWWRQW